MQLFTLASGSTGNCTLVRDQGCSILIDMGISTKRLREALFALGMSPDELSGILITHEHRDHICGLNTFVKKYEVPILAPRTIANHLRWSILEIEDYIAELDIGHENSVAGLSVLPFRTPHDTPESVGYRITGTSTLAFCTDFGYVSDEMREGLYGVENAVIEANHDIQMLANGAYPSYLKRRILSDHGHLSNTDCASLALWLAQSGTKSIVLAHLSRENNTPRLAYDTVGSILCREGFEAGRDIQLAVAPECQTLSVSLERCKNA